MTNDNRSRDDDWIILGHFAVFMLGLWLGFAMASGGICGQRATLVSFGQQIWITFMGEGSEQTTN